MIGFLRGRKPVDGVSDSAERGLIPFHRVTQGLDLHGRGLIINADDKGRNYLVQEPSAADPEAIRKMNAYLDQLEATLKLRIVQLHLTHTPGWSARLLPARRIQAQGFPKLFRSLLTLLAAHHATDLSCTVMYFHQFGRVEITAEIGNELLTDHDLYEALARISGLEAIRISQMQGRWCADLGRLFRGLGPIQAEFRVAALSAHERLAAKRHIDRLPPRWWRG